MSLVRVTHATRPTPWQREVHGYDLAALHGPRDVGLGRPPPHLREYGGGKNHSPPFRWTSLTTVQRCLLFRSAAISARASTSGKPLGVERLEFLVRDDAVLGFVLFEELRDRLTSPLFADVGVLEQRSQKLVEWFEGSPRHGGSDEARPCIRWYRPLRPPAAARIGHRPHRPITRAPVRRIDTSRLGEALPGEGRQRDTDRGDDCDRQ